MIDFWFQTQVDSCKTYIVMERCEKSLATLLPFSPLQERIKYFTHIVNGIDHLNANHIVHRDLKLHNVLIKDGIAKISDFGLALKLSFNNETGQY